MWRLGHGDAFFTGEYKELEDTVPVLQSYLEAATVPLTEEEKATQATQDLDTEI